MTPLYVAIEGVDGSGKTTLVKSVTDALNRYGIDVAVIKYPRDHTSEHVEQVNSTGSKDRQNKMNGDLARERAEDVFSTSRLECDVVIFDRYRGSGLAYGIANGFDEKSLDSLDGESIVPDITILLDVSAMRLADQSVYLNRVANVYLQIAKKLRWWVIAAKSANVSDMAVAGILSGLRKRGVKPGKQDTQAEPPHHVHAVMHYGTVMAGVPAAYNIGKHIAHIHEMTTHTFNALIEMRNDLNRLANRSHCSHDDEGEQK